MKTLLILGAGTAGTMVANKMAIISTPASGRSPSSIRTKPITISPVFSLSPSASTDRNDVIKPKRDYIPSGVNLIVSEIDRPSSRRTTGCASPKTIASSEYDYLVIATGTQPAPGGNARACVDGDWRRHHS